MGYESIGHHSMVHGLWCMIQSLKSQWFMGYGSPCIIHGVTLMGHRSWVNHSLLNSAHLIGLRRSSFHTLFCGIVNKVQNVGQEGFTSLDICQESNFTIYSRLTVYCENTEVTGIKPSCKNNKTGYHELPYSVQT